MMQNNLATPPLQPAHRPDPTGRLAFLRRFCARYPYLAALLLLVYWLAMLLGLGRLFLLVLLLTHVHMPVLLANLIGELLLLLVIILPLTLLGWWSEAGFTRGITAWGIVLCLVPLLLVCGPVLIGLPLIVSSAPVSIIVTAVSLALLVGIVEEGMFRGLILRSLLPRGIWPAVLLSALCFACVHLTNLLEGASLGYVFQQMILAFGTGVLFAALRLRTRSIWPGVFLHAGRDAAGLILLGLDPALMNAPLSDTATAYNTIFCILFLLNAVILLRSSQGRKLEVAYGLAPDPVPVAPPTSPVPWPYASSPIPYSNYTSPATYGEQPPFQASPNPPLYHDYTSPAAYGAQQPPETPAQDQ